MSSKKYLGKIGRHMRQSETPEIQDDPYFKLVEITINRVTKYAFWKNDCLPRAICAKKLLARKKIDSTLYLGVKKDPDNSRYLNAHAWIMIGDIPFIGASIQSNFTVVSYFS